MRNITIKLLDEEFKCDKISKNNIETFLSAKDQVELLESAVIVPFEDSLKKRIPYSQENQPGEKESIETRVGNYRFLVNVTPTKTPSYGQVFNQMESYLKGLEFGSENRRNRYGVRTIDDIAYASLPETLDAFSQFIDESIKPNIKVEIPKKSVRANLKEKLAALDLDIEEDYSVLNSENAARYMISKDLVERINSQVISPFQKEVKKATGFDRNNLPEGVQYRRIIVGDVLVFVTNSSVQSIRYADAVKGMMEYLGKMDSLVEAGERSTVPGIRKFQDTNYLSISMMRETFSQLKKENTEMIPRQTISYLKLPKADKVIID